MGVKTTKGKQLKTVTKSTPTMSRSLLTDVRQMILQAREGVARAIDSSLTLLHWNVGTRIRKDILKENRAEYGAGNCLRIGETIGNRNLDEAFPEKAFAI